MILRKVLIIPFLIVFSLESDILIDLSKFMVINLSDMGSVLETIGQNNTFDFDNKMNFYILDRAKKVLHKFDSTGKYIKELYINYSDFADIYGIGTLNIKKDTIFISDSFNASILKFNTEGKYFGKKNLIDYYVSPFWPVHFGKQYINSGTVKKKFDYKTYGAKFIKEVTLHDSNFNYVKTICRDSIILDKSREYDPGNYGLLCFNSENNAYVYRTSKVKYEIIVYNTSGDSVYSLSKKYSIVPYSDEDKKKIADLGGGGKMKHKVEFKNSIHNILADKYGRIWVRSSVNDYEDGKYYDVFEKDKLMGRQKLGIEDAEIPYFVKDKLVCFNYGRKTLTIYNY